MTKKMICDSAEACRHMDRMYSTDIVCGHKLSHNFIRPKYEDDRIGSCLKRKCRVFNKQVKCIPFKEEVEKNPPTEDGCMYGIEFSKNDDVCRLCSSYGVCLKGFKEDDIPDNSFDCPRGYVYVGYIGSDEGCRTCAVQEGCKIITINDFGPLDEPPAKNLRRCPKLNNKEDYDIVKTTQCATCPDKLDCGSSPYTV